jgi:hypothetical protein
MAGWLGSASQLVIIAALIVAVPDTDMYTGQLRIWPSSLAVSLVWQ